MKKLIPLLLLTFLISGCQSLSSNEVYIAHVLVSIPEGATPKMRTRARTRIQSVELVLKSGAIGFSQAALESSDCPSKDNGGIIGWLDLNDPEVIAKYPPQLLHMAGTLKKDEISKPFRTKYGYHILKCYGRR